MVQAGCSRSPSSGSRSFGRKVLDEFLGSKLHVLLWDSALWGVAGALGGAGLWLAGDAGGGLAAVLVGLCWLMEGAAFLLMLPVPAVYRGFVEMSLGVIEDPSVVRVLALFGVLLGALLIWAGLTQDA